VAFASVSSPARKMTRGPSLRWALFATTFMKTVLNALTTRAPAKCSARTALDVIIPSTSGAT